MAGLSDLIGLAEGLAAQPVSVHANRCVAVRNRNATCRRCVEACVAGAIEVAPGELRVDAAACANCGACAAACPTSALVLASPSGTELEQALARSARACEGTAVVACARALSLAAADPERVAGVPCLGHVGEESLVKCASGGATDIVLVDGECATCRYGAIVGALEQALAGTRALLAAWAVDATIERSSQLPSIARSNGEEPSLGHERRHVLSQAKELVAEAAAAAASQAAGAVLPGAPPSNGKGAAPSIRDALDARRNLAVLDALDRAGEPGDGEVATRLFGSVAIDVEACSGCGICLLACPTRALRPSRAWQPAGDDAQLVEFQAADCTQCGLCADACLRGCVSVSPVVEVRELADFEPRVLRLPPARRGAALFQRHRRNRDS